MIEDALLESIETFDLDEHRKRIYDRQRDRELGFIAMVVGEGNFGKSSLVNSLCGRSVAAVSVIPKTFKVDVFVSSQSDSASVRRLESSTIDLVSHEQAREINDAAELGMKTGKGSDLAEIIWRFQGLDLPQGIALVDTPGISQSLSHSAHSVSLTQVLGSSFEVDKVWAHWFHRADVVLWGFCANKMQSAETMNALEGALSLFDKKVIPVATKCDAISVERWQEIHEQFERIYVPMLGDRMCAPLHLCVCGGRNMDLVGHGVRELNSTLKGLMNRASILKEASHKQFLVNECHTVSNTLQITASELVGNLRIISSLGDALAGEAGKEADRATGLAVSSIDNYLRTLRHGNEIKILAKSIYTKTGGGRQGNLEGECRAGLMKLVDSSLVQEHVDKAFKSASLALEAMASRLASGADVGRVTFKASGEVLRRSVALRLDLNAVDLAASLPFSVRFQYPQGFLESAWDAIKGFFGFDRFSEHQILQSLSSALVVTARDLVGSRNMALYSGYAPAIRDAINRAIVLHLEDSDSDAIEKLSTVDMCLPKLNVSIEGLVTTFGPQGEYWSTISPRTETLLNLAREELARILPDFRLVVSGEFPRVSPFSVPKSSLFWKTRRKEYKTDQIHSKRFLSIVLPRKSRLDVSVSLLDVVSNGVHREQFMQGDKKCWREKSYYEYVCEAYQKYLHGHSLVMFLDKRLAEATVGARYKSAGDRLASLGLQAFKDAVLGSQRCWLWSGSVTRIWGLTLSRGSLSLLSFLSCAGVVVGLWIPGFGVLLGVMALLALLYGFCNPYLSFHLAYQSQIRDAVRNEIAVCSLEASERLPEDVVDQIIQGMTAELAPRPLQALLVKAGIFHSGL